MKTVKEEITDKTSNKETSKEGNKKCFVMMPISDVEEYDKGHFTRVYEHLIKPAVEAAGFEPIRADDTSKANFIVIDILQQILDCDIAICDLSSRNPNVFYELGIRQAFNKKTVLICDNKTIKPFDTSGIRTLEYNSSLRIDEIKKSIPILTKYIEATISASEKDINSILQLLSIDKPATLPNKATLSDDSRLILNAINDLCSRLARIDNAVVKKIPSRPITRDEIDCWDANLDFEEIELNRSKNNNYDREAEILNKYAVVQ